jgi:hypothetical protein
VVLVGRDNRMVSVDLSALGTAVVMLSWCCAGSLTWRMSEAEPVRSAGRSRPAAVRVAGRSAGVAGT